MPSTPEQPSDHLGSSLSQTVPHSPLPWRRVRGIVFCADDYAIAPVNGHANAELIVTAVNSHAQLTCDLAEAVEALRNLANTFHEGRAIPESFGSEGYVLSVVEAAELILSKHSKEQQK